MKIKALIGAVALTSVLSVVTAGASTVSQYVSWKQHSVGTVQKTANDLSQFAIDLSNDSVAGVRRDLNVIGGDASAFNQHANSPDSVLNGDFEQFAINLAGMAAAGRALLAGNGSSAVFANYVHKVESWEATISNRLKYDNNRW